MTTRINYINGGYGILVSYMAGICFIELDPSVIQHGGNSDDDNQYALIPEGVFVESTCTKLIYADSHGHNADTQTWSNTTDNTGLQMTVQTATVYDASGDKVLYSMVRDLSFNSHGQLIHVSSERSITVDNTESCS